MPASGRHEISLTVRAACAAGLVGPVVLAVVLAVGAARPEAGPVLLLFVGATVLATHVGASLVRAWQRARATLFVLVIGALAAAPLVVVGGDAALEGVVTLANIALPVHVALQVHRVAAVLARPQRAHVVAAVLLAFAGVIAMLAGPREPLALRGFLSIGAALPVVAVLVVAAVAGAAFTSRNVIATLAFVVAGAGWLLPLALGDAIDPAMASMNAFAVAHGVQLVWLALFVASRAAHARGRAFDGLAHVGMALVVGAVLLFDVPWLASRVAGIDVVTAVLATQATLSLAHVALDALVFRLNDSAMRAAIAEDATPASSARAQVSNARALAFLVPGTLLALGIVVDVLQTWLTRPAASDHDLLRAEALHPADARVVLPRAVRALAHDDKDPARAALGEIANARAFSPEAARARLLLCALELDAIDAGSLSSSSLSSSSSSSSSSSCADVPASLEDDADVLALGARLSLAAGDVARAKDRARRAVERTPESPAALAALGIVEAHLLEATAVAHLERALALQQAHIGGRDPLVGDASSLDAGVALAQAYETRGDHARALDVATRVLEGAGGADRPRHAMRALTLQGHALEDKGDARAALEAYQRALRIASFASSPADEAAVWLDYGHLLDRSQAGEEAVYASALKAKALVDALPTKHPQRARLLERATTRVVNTELVTPQQVQTRVRADVDGHALSAIQLQYTPTTPP